ncbi:MAG: hypothetical protein K1X29_09075 [Bdellovibrionales bacterium]|nr:hypothetical protein [Bdellovibrionales bacterium]
MKKNIDNYKLDFVLEGLRKRKEISQLLVFTFLSCVFFIYNNCSQQGNQFATSNEVLNGLKDPSIVIESGKPATNQRLVKLDLINFNQEVRGILFNAKSMRISLEDQIEKASWVPFKNSFILDLNDHYASDGSKDGYKNIVVEVINEDKTSVTVKGSILLDTLPPKVVPKGLLSTGLKSGQLFSKGTGVKLEWEADDQPSTLGLSSGLSNTEGLSLAWSSLGDCSENNLKDKTSWGPFSNSKNFVWPQSNLLDTFFICISIKDVAGNISTVLSQPMSSVWGVFGGDNNVGNGGSLQAPNVRFAYPTEIAADSKGQIFIFDSYLKTIRTIKQNGVIEQFAGNGRNSVPVEGSDVVNIPINSISGMAFDSNDNLYFAGGSGIWKIQRNASTGAAESFTKLYNGNTEELIVKQDTTGDTIYINQYTNIEAGSDPTTAKSYIFKIKINELVQLRSQLGSVPKDSDLLNKYVVVGNGSVSLTSNSPKFGVAYDPLSTPIGYVRAMTLADNGDLYFATGTDGLNRGFGNFTLRVLKQSDPEPKIYMVLGGDVNWRWGLTTIAMGGELHLIASGVEGLLRLRIDDLQFPLSKAPTKLTVPSGIKEKSFSTVVITKVNNEVLDKPLILTANASSGQIVQVSPDFTTTSRFGRALFLESDTDAQSAVLGNPVAISEDTQGNIYVFEALNNVIRKISPNNQIKLFAGQPDGLTTPIDYGSPLQNLRLNGGDYESGYRFQMAFDEKKNIIYLGDGINHSINQLKLNDSTYSKLDLTTSTLSNGNPDSFPVFGLAIDNTASDTKLWVYRANRYSPYGAAGMELSNLEGSLTQRQLFGNQNIGSPDPNFVIDPSLGKPESIAIDSAGLLYFVNNGSLWKYGKSLGLKKLINGGQNATSLVAINENLVTHIVSANSNTLKHISFDASDKVVTNETLCVPGSFVNNPGQMIVAHDGNLLIADSNNNRVLKYYIRSASGGLQFVNSTSCK